MTVPFLAGGNVGVRASAVVAGGPVNLNGVIRTPRVGAVQIQLFRAAPNIFGTRVNHINADVVFGAGESPGGMLVHDAAVSVFVLDRVLIEAGHQNGLLRGVNHDAGAHVFGGGREHDAVGVDGEPVEARIELEDELALAHVRGGIRGRMGELGVGVNAALAAFHRVAQLNIHASATTATAATECTASWSAATAGIDSRL